MPFVHCEACSHHVIVDPSGICPEGHRTGVVSPRARLGGGLAGGVDGGQVASSMGARRDDSDEPQPWIGRVEPDEVAEYHDPAPAGAGRPIRPLAAPSEQAGAAREAPEPPAAVDREAMLRELQALGGLGIDPAPSSEPRREPRPEPRLDQRPAAGTNGSGPPDLRVVPDPAPDAASAREAPASPRRQRPVHDDEVASLEAMLSDLANDPPASSRSAPPARGQDPVPAPAAPPRTAPPRTAAPRGAAPPPPPGAPPPSSPPPQSPPPERESATVGAPPAPTSVGMTGTFTARNTKRRRFGR